MNELIKVDYSKEQPTVSGRDLHQFLEVEPDTMTGLRECVNTDFLRM